MDHHRFSEDSRLHTFSDGNYILKTEDCGSIIFPVKNISGAFNSAVQRLLTEHITPEPW